jgi:hypothetical protein
VIPIYPVSEPSPSGFCHTSHTRVSVETTRIIMKTNFAVVFSIFAAAGIASVGAQTVTYVLSFSLAYLSSRLTYSSGSDTAGTLDGTSTASGSGGGLPIIVSSGFSIPSAPGPVSIPTNSGSRSFSLAPGSSGSAITTTPLSAATGSPTGPSGVSASGSGTAFTGAAMPTGAGRVKEVVAAVGAGMIAVLL